MNASATPTEVIPGFTDLRVVGEGASAMVYAAKEDAFAGRQVALKVLKVAATGSDAGRRFEAECLSLGRLAGTPNVVVPLQRGETPDGRPWYSMELFTGGSLADRLRSGPLSADELVRAVKDLATALSAAHGRGLLHRDVKPANAFLVGPTTKLADFGMAAASGVPIAEADRLVSVLHAAPEVLGGAAPSIQSDVYSLASTAYELWNGHPPFAPAPGQTAEDVARRVRQEPVPTMTRHGLTGAQAEAIISGLAKDPSDRPSSAGEFAERLLAAHGPALDTPPVFSGVPAPPGPGPADLLPPPFDGTVSAGAMAPVPAPPSVDDTLLRGDRPAAGPVFTGAPAAPILEQPVDHADGPDLGATGYVPGLPELEDQSTDEPETRERGRRSPLQWGLIVGAAVSGILVLGLLLLSLLAPSPAADRPTAKGTVPGTPAPAGDPSLAPADVKLVQGTEPDTYELSFSDRTDGKYPHQVLGVGGGGSAPPLTLPNGSTEAVLVGSPYRCVVVAAVADGGATSFNDDKVCAP